jgi:hypothetical protein
VLMLATGTPKGSMHREKKRGSREVLTALEMDSSGRTGRRRGPVAGVVHPEALEGDRGTRARGRSWCMRTERGREMGIRWG